MREIFNKRTAEIRFLRLFFGKTGLELIFRENSGPQFVLLFKELHLVMSKMHWFCQDHDGPKVKFA